jgi:endothelin-converting enzyme/putative endopeptidase
MSKCGFVFLLAGSCLLVSAQSNPGFDVKTIDTKADPCVDFFQYACGNWLAANPIPQDQTAWGRFSVLAERNRAILKDILETSSAKKTRTPVEQKIGDYYDACMDTKAIDAKGTAPIKPAMQRIAQVSDKAAVVDQVAWNHMHGVGTFFRFSSDQDFKNSSEVIAEVDQGGLSLPDRDYYFRTDPKSVEIRKKFVEHVQKVFELYGDTSEKAGEKAKDIMEIETALAKRALDRVSRRDPQKVYHRISLTELQAMTPSFDWTKYLKEIGAPAVQSLNVTEPEFFKGFEQVLKDAKLPMIKDYFQWHYLNSVSMLLPTAFDKEHFNFFSKTLQGAPEQQARWKRCVRAVDGDLGEALGQKYVEITYGQEGKARTLQMVGEIEKAMQADIQNLDWMTPTTKKKALEKLHQVANKIGYPEKWRDYSALKIAKDDPIGNSLGANQFEFKRDLAKIGKPVDLKEWFMSPPTVNAYYDPQKNNINFPAGILQPPFFDAKLDDAVNYGAIGSVIGHELTHGFDDQGRQFDLKGDMKDWWTPEDAKEFERRAECIEKEYSGFTAVDDLKLNGKLTLGENVADNGGVRIAYMALMDSLAKHTVGKIDGYTPEQRFFLGFGQSWCGQNRPERARMLAQVDPHSPDRYRVNGTVSNMPEFQKAFGCKEGQPMVRQNACHVW